MHAAIREAFAHVEAAAFVLFKTFAVSALLRSLFALLVSLLLPIRCGHHALVRRAVDVERSFALLFSLSLFALIFSLFSPRRCVIAVRHVKSLNATVTGSDRHHQFACELHIRCTFALLDFYLPLIEAASFHQHLPP